MLNTDLASSPLASEWPDMADACDSLADRLRDALLPFIPAHLRAGAFSALDGVVGDDEHGGTLDREQIAHGLMHAVYGDTSLAPEIRMIAAAALKRFGKDGRSYQQMGDEFGVTRACIHAHSRRIERNTGLKCRADKSENARRISTEKASGRQRSGTRASGILRQPRGIFSFLRLRGV